MTAPTRVTHIITGLQVGGSELMMHRLLQASHGDSFHHDVVSLTGGGPVADLLEQAGISVHELRMHSGRPSPLALLRLVRLLRHLDPGVVQTWMYHADLLGGIAARLAGRIPTVWNIRNTSLDPTGTKRKTVWVVHACARLSRFLPDRIVSCSEVARREHEKLGYARARMQTIPNGFDLQRYQPHAGHRSMVRQELGVEDDAECIGLFARYHWFKGHEVFFRAASRIVQRHPRVRFVLAGDGITWDNAVLREEMAHAGVETQCILLGPRADMPRLNAAMDFVVSPSLGEGFPNAVGEAMACGVPCAVTDVGDSGLIVGDTGRVVPPGEPAALAAAMEALLRMGPVGRQALGRSARQRIEERYDLALIVGQYESLYRELADHVRH